MVNFNEDHLPMDTAKSSWQAVDRLRRAEEVLAENNLLPLQAMMGYRASLSNALMKNLIQLRENAKEGVRGHKGLIAIAELGEELGEFKRASIKRGCLKDVHPKEPNPYEALSPPQRLLACSFVEKAVTSARLKELLHEPQSNPQPQQSRGRWLTCLGASSGSPRMVPPTWNA